MTQLDTLVSFHWLRTAERIQFKLASNNIVYRSLHGKTLGFLQSSDLAYIVWLTFHRISTTCDHPACMVNVGDRAFATA
jgi:hypothetical protein